MKPHLFWNVSVIHFEPRRDKSEVLRVEAFSSGSAIKAAAEKLHEAFDMDFIINRVEGPYT